MTTPMHNGPVLTAHEAIIQTASVNIQTLRVGKKQVTMGMFRQLPYEELIRWDALGAVCAGFPVSTVYDGTPWGHVNYWWDGHFPHECAYTDDLGRWRSHGERRHLVWQYQDQLCRVVVCARLPTWVCQMDELLADYTATDVRTAWAHVWGDLVTLPQLFIAV